MISTLHIKNIGIIDDLEINLNQGFNVLTGETGAGKTLIIDSLQILAGGRFSKDMIRKGETYSFVEACIYLPDNQRQVDGNIIISREIYENGRNLCKINGRLVQVNELKEFMKEIIDIHAQHDNQALLHPNTHIEYFDDFIGEEIKIIKMKYQECFVEYQKIKEELANNYGDEKQKSRKLDLLKYQINEIEEVDLKLQEEEELEEQKRVMVNFEKIMQNLQIADEKISDYSIDTLSDAIRALEKIQDIDIKYEKLLNGLKSIYYDMQEISRDLIQQKEEMYYDEPKKKEIEDRLDLIYSLKRKYGNTIQEIVGYKLEIEKEVKRIENLEEYNKKLKSKLNAIEERMSILAKQINKIRVENKEVLEEKIKSELQDLEMKYARFIVEIKFDIEKGFHKNGLDQVEFLICTNIGQDAKPLVKIASGGELSRIMLAIKTVLSNVDKTPILIFDEIDTGISGQAANMVSEKLKKISKDHQVLCITHLAPIAAKGDYNYYISKKVKEGKTKTEITLLKEEEVLNEIARISSGDVTKVSIELARELRKKKVS